MSQDSPSSHSDRYPIRLPDGMRDELKAVARINGRSMNAEIVARLSNSGVGGGETLRDRFAMAAIPGLLASLDPDLEQIAAYPNILAADAYAIADAMIDLRAQGND